MAQRQRANPDPQPPLTPLSLTASPRIAAAPRRSTEQLPGHAATSPLRAGRRDRHRPLQLGLPRPGLATANASSRTPSSPGLATSSPDSAPASPSSSAGGTNCPSSLGLRPGPAAQSPRPTRYIIVEVKVGRAEPARPLPPRDGAWPTAPVTEGPAGYRLARRAAPRPAPPTRSCVAEDRLSTQGRSGGGRTCSTAQASADPGS